ncbi:MAG TPA: VWA domain-containing protein [Steroidobacteraceae bacterium]|nr:VWA domain-containing protein [Steroidobacteraceae bacterium]
MRFTASHWLFVGLAACLVLFGIWYRHDARQRSALAHFVARHLRGRLTASISWSSRYLQRALFLGSIVCLCAALAGPLLGFHLEQTTRRGNEVIFAIDTSRSMLTPDVKPNRLTRAKLAIEDMAQQLDGDAVGVVAFAGSAFLVCPPTFDHDTLRKALESVDTDTIPKGGTNIPSAIEVAQKAFSRSPVDDRFLILVTDGENLEGDALAAAKLAKTQDSLKIYTVGIGTTEGDSIPIPIDQGGGFVRDESGDLVKSRLDETGLKAIAAATSAAYVHVGDQGEEFEAFLSQVFGSVTKHDLIYRQRKVYNERYQWPLAAALMLLLAGLLVDTRRSSRRSTPAVALTIAASAICFATMTLSTPTRSESADQSIELRLRSDPAAPTADYNAGASAYRAGKFLQAAQSFQQSIKSAPASDARRVAEQQDAYYNLGDALYRAGQQQEKSAPLQAMQKWGDAVRAYDTALQIRADDADSKYNRDLVSRKIVALKRLELNNGGTGKGQRADGGQGQGNASSASQRQPPPPGQSQPQGDPRPQQLTPSERRDGQRPSSQMSLEEAQELLDSDKPEEHRSLTNLPDRRGSKLTPDTANKNW